MYNGDALITNVTGIRRASPIARRSVAFSERIPKDFQRMLDPWLWNANSTLEPTTQGSLQTRYFSACTRVVCEMEGYVKPSVYQGQYNALCRRGERQLLSTLRANNVAFHAYSRTARGAFNTNSSLMASKVRQFTGPFLVASRPSTSIPNDRKYPALSPAHGTVIIKRLLPQKLPKSPI